MILSQVDVFSVPTRIITETEENLRLAGRNGLELFVLWSGCVHGTEFLVETSHVPRQTSYRSDSGLMVRVEGDALHQLNAWLYEHGESLAVQVHAHPTEAFHSVTDDTYPIVTADGSISVVTADFCRQGFFSESTATYRLDGHTWLELDPPLGLFRVI
jgi:hypothetical protein